MRHGQNDSSGSMIANRAMGLDSALGYADASTHALDAKASRIGDLLTLSSLQ